jgi:hypothetical protein
VVADDAEFERHAPTGWRKPIAAGTPESGTGTTTSASTGLSLASSARRCACARRRRCNALDLRIRPREVDVFEDAEAARLLHERLDGPDAVAVDDHDLARFDVAHEAGADDVQRAGLGGEDPGIRRGAEHQRTHAQRIAAPISFVGEQQTSE